MMSGQRGGALLVVLILSVALALMALSALDGTTSGIRSAASESDRNTALQAAEAALRDAEQDITLNITTSTVFTGGCTNGLCMVIPEGGPLFLALDWTDEGTTRVYGQYTGAAALTGVSAQPRYVIESLATLPPARGESRALGGAAGTPGGGSSGSTIYRVTAFASGALPGTQVFLQSTVVKAN